MKLADLNPRLKGSLADGVVIFDCPHPGCDHQVRVCVSAGPYHERPKTADEMKFFTPGDPSFELTVKIWQASGEFPDTLTLTPSIDIVEKDEKGKVIGTRCWHGHVTNGAIT